MPSLNTSWPTGIVTDFLPPKVTGVRVPSTMLPEYSCRPTVTLLKVTGCEPKTLEKRNRIMLAQRSGLTMDRKVCSVAPAVLASGKGKPRSGWILAGAKVVGGPGGAGATGGVYTKNVAGEVAQEATHFLPVSCASPDDADKDVAAVTTARMPRVASQFVRPRRRARLEKRVIAVNRCIRFRK